MRKCRVNGESKKSKSVRRLIIFISVIVIIGIAVLIYFNTVINPVIVTTSESKIKMLTSRAVNSTISEILNDSDIYDELITVTTDSQGKISMIQANAIKINSLSKEISTKALAKVESIGEQGIAIPLGTFTGMPLFAGKGPDVYIKVSPVGTLDCIFKSEFIQAGINQTLHRIYLEVTTSVNLILPIFDDVVNTFTQVMICESIIVGEVPEFYFNNSMGSLLDLVPDNK